MHRSIGILICILFAFLGCRKHDLPVHVANAVKQAGTNGSELMAVIDHYSRNKKDSLKLEAAYFIVENLDGLITLDTNSTAINARYFDLFSECWNPDGRIMYSNVAKAIDSLNKSLDLHPVAPPVRYLHEARVISSKFLIDNIDDAFYAWENFPWAKSVSFEEFCNYILPYRCTNTYSETARDFFLRLEDTIRSSVTDDDDPFKVGEFIVENVDYWFKESADILYAFPYLGPIKFSDLIRGKMGPCMDANSVRITALRSLGIPAALNEVYWSNSSGGHFFYDIINEDFDTITQPITNENVNRKTQHIISASSYDIPEIKGTPPYVEVHYNRTIPKVYRRCFNIQRNSLAAIKSPEDEIPVYFEDKRLEDVTDEYLETTDIRVDLNEQYTDHKFTYLCYFDNNNWVPIAWAKIDDGGAIFTNMGKNIMYLPAYYKKGEILPAGHPFLLALNGVAKKIVPDTTKVSIRLYTKYAVRSWYLRYGTYLVGGRFQGANRANFSDSVNLHTIKHLPFYQTEIKMQPTQPYRYLIYQFSGLPKTYISEIEFFGLDQNGREIKLEGSLIGNPGQYPYTAEKISDSVRHNLFKAKENAETYIGIDLGKGNEARVTKIKYMPYGDDNGVAAGDKYELYYWLDRWVSLGIEEAEANNSVVFDNVPEGALLLLKNTGGGYEHRVFLYENGKQKFW